MKFLLLSNFERSTNAGFISRAVVRLSLTTMDNWKEKLTAFIFHFLEGTVQSDWFFTRSVFSYLCPRATVTLSWVAEYIPTFVAIFHKYISFCRLGSIFKQTHRSLPQADLWILSFLSLKSLWLTKNLVLVSEWIFISNSVITLVDKRPKNRLQLILIIRKRT